MGLSIILANKRTGIMQKQGISKPYSLARL